MARVGLRSGTNEDCQGHSGRGRPGARGGRQYGTDLEVAEVITENVARVIPPAGMSAADIRLLEIAQDLLARVWVHGRHEVATALRTADGSIYTGVHVEGSCRRSSICAEGVAMGTARAGLAPGRPLQIEAIVSAQLHPAGQFR